MYNLIHIHTHTNTHMSLALPTERAYKQRHLKRNKHDSYLKVADSSTAAEYINHAQK